MKKTNAAKVLPVSLLRQVQCYVQGEPLYIPALKEQRKAWGERSGIRRQLQQRNRQIIADHRQGATAEQLSQTYFLSVTTIRNILYRKDCAEK